MRTQLREIDNKEIEDDFGEKKDFKGVEDLIIK